MDSLVAFGIAWKSGSEIFSKTQDSPVIDAGRNCVTAILNCGTGGEAWGGGRDAGVMEETAPTRPGVTPVRSRLKEVG